MKNGKAVGPDQMPNELLKYAPDRFYEEYASLINRLFEISEHVPSFTEGYVAPLQKPGKPRPKVLLRATDPYVFWTEPENCYPR